MRHEILYILAAMSVLSAGCHNEPPVIGAPDEKSSITENIANANRYIVESEETQINAYVERRQWKVSQTQMGVRINEYECGEGAKIGWEEKVVVEYSVSDLSGKSIYSPMRDTIVVGHRQPTAGLDAAMLQLHHGSKAHVIVPSNEAYGMIGDGDLIASRKVIVYDVRVE